MQEVAFYLVYFLLTYFFILFFSYENGEFNTLLCNSSQQVALPFLPFLFLMAQNNVSSVQSFPEFWTLLSFNHS